MRKVWKPVWLYKARDEQGRIYMLESEKKVSTTELYDPKTGQRLRVLKGERVLKEGG